MPMAKDLMATRSDMWGVRPPSFSWLVAKAGNGH